MEGSSRPPPELAATINSPDGEEAMAKLGKGARFARQASIESTGSTSSRMKKSDTQNSIAAFDFATKALNVTETKKPFLIIMPDNQFGKFWQGLVSLLLIYIGTIFPYRLCFIEFRVSIEPLCDPPHEAWKYIGHVLDTLFWMDLALNFLFAYTTDNGKVVKDHKQIALKYLKAWFWLDLLACLPPEFFNLLMGMPPNSGGGDPCDGGAENPNEAVRLTRMSRMGRLTRLTRLVRITRLLRLAKLAKFMGKNPVFKLITAMLGQSRTAMVLKFAVALFFVIHLLACGWYLVAYLINDPQSTWVFRREDGSIIDKDPVVHWTHAVYFVFTVFTTVGFGDIYAVEVPEIAYVMLLQLLGAVLQSIIVSEMIKVLTWVDMKAARLEERKNLVRAYCAQAEIEEESTVQELLRHVEEIGNEEDKAPKFDRLKMQRLIEDSVPKELQVALPQAVFKGRCAQNSFFRQFSDTKPLLATSAYLTSRHLVSAEMVYQYGDTPNHVFLVLSGSVAHVAMPSPMGGVVDISMHLSLNTPMGAIRLSQSERSTGSSSGSPTSASKSVASSPDKRSASKSLVGKGLDLGSAIEASLNLNLGNSPPGQKGMAGLSKDEEVQLAPFSIQGHRTFFGEWEMIHPTTRQWNVRCEKSATVLMLPRIGFTSLTHEFPQCMDQLKWIAKTRQQRRVAQLARLVRTTDGRSLAASGIQARFRGWKVRREIVESRWRKSAKKAFSATLFSGGGAWTWQYPDAKRPEDAYGPGDGKDEGENSSGLAARKRRNEEPLTCLEGLQLQQVQDAITQFQLFKNQVSEICQSGDMLLRQQDVLQLKQTSLVNCQHEMMRMMHQLNYLMSKDSKKS